MLCLNKTVVLPFNTATCVPPHAACLTRPRPLRGSSRGELIWKSGFTNELHSLVLLFVHILLCPYQDNSITVNGHFISGICLPVVVRACVCVDLFTCVASVTEASCRYSEFPQPKTCPSVDTAKLQSPYVVTC